MKEEYVLKNILSNRFGSDRAFENAASGLSLRPSLCGKGTGVVS